MMQVLASEGSPEWAAPAGWGVAAVSILALIYKTWSQVKSNAEKAAITHYRKLVVDLTGRIERLEGREREQDEQITTLRDENIEYAGRTQRMANVIIRYSNVLRDYERAMKEAGVPFRPLSYNGENELFGLRDLQDLQEASGGEQQ